MLRNKDLWLADLQHSDHDRQLTKGSLGAGYAGVVRSAGGTDIYYTSIDQVTETPDGPEGVLTVYKRSLPDGEPVVLLSFGVPAKQVEFYCCDAAVSPNGASLAYADQEGMKVLDVASGMTAVLALNTPCDSTKGCQGNFFPQWSTDSSRLMFFRIGYEAGTYYVFDFGSWSESRVQFVNLGGYRSTFQPQTTIICGREEGDSLQIFAYNLSTAKFVTAPKTTDFPYSCEASSSGTIATSTFRFDTGEQSVFLFDPDGTAKGEIHLLPAARGFAGFLPLEIEAWLPDESGVILSASGRSYEVAFLNGTVAQLDLPPRSILAILPALTP